MRVAGFRSAVALLADLLHLVKGVDVDDGRVRVVEDRLVLYRILAGRLVPDGIGVGLEVDRAAVYSRRARISEMPLDSQ